MTNTRFNKLWNTLLERGCVEFADSGETLELSEIPKRNGREFGLRQVGRYGNTIMVDWNRERFREILVD